MKRKQFVAIYAAIELNIRSTTPGDELYLNATKNEFCTTVLSGFKVFVKSLSLSGGSLTSVMHFPVLFA